MPQADLAPSVPELAATLHAYFAGRRLHLFARSCCELTGRDVAPIAAIDDGGRPCPTCEGDCVVPDCADPGCECRRTLDPPCRERACPTCGGLGTV